MENTVRSGPRKADPKGAISKLVKFLFQKRFRGGAEWCGIMRNGAERRRAPAKISKKQVYGSRVRNKHSQKLARGQRRPSAKCGAASKSSSRPAASAKPRQILFSKKSSPWFVLVRFGSPWFALENGASQKSQNPSVWFACASRSQSNERQAQAGLSRRGRATTRTVKRKINE